MNLFLDQQHAGELSCVSDYTVQVGREENGDVLKLDYNFSANYFMKQEVLVIDDNFDIRNLISEILKDKNYNVRVAANFDQAVSEIHKKLPDIAVIDVKLDKGDKDGIDLLKLIIGKNKLTPVIMISGHATVQIAVEAIRLGAYEFIEKPFDQERLMLSLIHISEPTRPY